MEPSDEALVLACRAGDAAAWESLVTRYQGLVYAIARRSRLDEDQAADVCQHVFTALVEHLDRLDQPKLVGSWITTTARHEAWRLRRRERVAEVRVGADEAMAGALPDDGPLPDELLLRLERQHRVRAMVEALDERCRKLLTLLFYRTTPAPYGEIAAALGLSEGSIGPTRARCLQRLRRLLGGFEL